MELLRYVVTEMSAITGIQTLFQLLEKQNIITNGM